MRIFLCAFVVMLALSIICATVTPAAVIEKWEEEQLYSMGIASEKRLFDSSERDEYHRVYSSVFEAEETFVLNQEESQGEEESIFATDGTLSLRFDDDALNRGNVLRKKISYEEDAQLVAFTYSDPPFVLKERLTDVELCYLFGQIVSSCNLPVPIHGRLEEISIVKKGEEIWLCAEINVFFAELIETYAIDGLPSEELFYLLVHFEVKDSEISADYDKIILCCDSMDLPETLLAYGCRVVFRSKDYKYFLGNALRNVFVNAGIYR